jgi:DNA-binding transcriptional MerR regulator
VATVTIGGLAAELGVSNDTVRYYERRGLLPEPERTGAGYRLYGDEDRWRLAFILRAKHLGFTLREIVGLLEQPADHVHQNPNRPSPPGSATWR